MPKNSHDAYIAAAPKQFRAILSQPRAQLARALPGAEEVMKYDMPGFQIEGTIVAGYAAFSKQCGLYVDPDAIAAHAKEIASLKLKATKTGVTFSASNPITDELARKLAVSSQEEGVLADGACDAARFVRRAAGAAPASPSTRL